MNPFRRHNPAPDEPERPAEASAPGPAEPSADPDQTAALIDALQADAQRLQKEAEELRAQRDSATEGHKRALADFQNFQRRSAINEREAREQGVRDVLHGVMNVVDHCDMALSQGQEQTTVAAVIQGVSIIRDELLRALQLRGVGVIRPERGEAFDPAVHKAIAQQPAQGVEAGAVLATLRVGFSLDGRLVRPAEVMVAMAGDRPAAGGE
ncbi:MAG: nucleotide exchange factor GrpE [Isosphaera sp.]|nr:nucleotide exchange factor GrpE [Isosphaera sp.]